MHQSYISGMLIQLQLQKWVGDEKYKAGQTWAVEIDVEMLAQGDGRYIGRMNRISIQWNIESKEGTIAKKYAEMRRPTV